MGELKIMKAFDNVLKFVVVILLSYICGVLFYYNFIYDTASKYKDLEIFPIENFNQLVVLDYSDVTEYDRELTYLAYNNEIIKADKTTWETLNACVKAIKEGERIGNIFGIEHNRLIRLNYYDKYTVIVGVKSLSNKK